MTDEFSSMEEFLRDAPCRRPGFEFKPWWYYDHQRRLLYCYLRDEPSFIREVSNTIELMVSSKDGSITGCRIWLGGSHEETEEGNTANRG